MNLDLKGINTTSRQFLPGTSLKNYVNKMYFPVQITVQKVKAIRLILACLATFVFLLNTSCKKDSTPIPVLQSTPEIESLKINQLQVVASHNSYKRFTFTPLFNFAMTITGFLPPEINATNWDYDHLPIPEQLGQYGVRGFELDIYNDPRGGKFYNRGGNALVNVPIESNIPDLKTPGFKVMHLPDMDYRTNYYTFRQALLAIKNWSNKHPHHVPIFVMVESKGFTIGDILPISGFARSVPYKSSSADEIDTEIKSVFGNSLSSVITPDKVRGSFNTLNEAVLAGNWPSLGEARGKVIFILDGDLKTHYLEGHPSLRDRAMFVFSSPGRDEAAFLIYNEPESEFYKTVEAVQAGYIVRTMADAGTLEARSGNYNRMNAAFNNGAQMISTDYYRPDLRHLSTNEWTDYKVRFPDNTGFRINPVSATDKVGLGKIPE
jgi:hypothetical protein